jgi:hypothetical protein
MNIRKTRTLAAAALGAALSAFLLSACNGRTISAVGDFLFNRPTERKWTEDVLLADGTTIVVKRTVAFKETNSLSGDAYNAVESDATVAFTGNLSQLPAWRAPLMALLLYRNESASEWVLIATTTSCERWNELGAPRVMYLPDKPDTLYWEYRLKPEGWREVPLSKMSVGRPVNLLHRYQEKLGTKHVTVVFRKALESDDLIVKRFVRTEERHKVNCSADNIARNKRAQQDSFEIQSSEVKE